MTLFQALILGVVQGATEFLPVSSSGHLIIVPKLLGMQEQPLVFDTTMHLATALTLLVYFFKDYIVILRKFIEGLFKEKKLYVFDPTTPSLLLLAISSLPAAVLGFLLDNKIEGTFRDVRYVLLFVAIGTVLMIAAHVYGKGTRDQATFKEGVAIGFFQSLALFPGVSRSGATISGSMLMGLKREYAARFSFLISVPIVVAAAFFKILSTDWANSGLTFAELSIGFVSSFVTGMFAVRFLLSYLKDKGLKIFIIYRVLLILFVLVTLL